MFSTQAFSFRNDGDGVELRFKLEGEIFLSYILSDPQLLWILYFLETSNWIVRYNNRTNLYLVMRLSDNRGQYFYQSFTCGIQI